VHCGRLRRATDERHSESGTRGVRTNTRRSPPCASPPLACCCSLALLVASSLNAQKGPRNRRWQTTRAISGVLRPLHLRDLSVARYGMQATVERPPITQNDCAQLYSSLLPCLRSVHVPMRHSTELGLIDRCTPAAVVGCERPRATRAGCSQHCCRCTPHCRALDIRSSAFNGTFCSLKRVPLQCCWDRGDGRAVQLVSLRTATATPNDAEAAASAAVHKALMRKQTMTRSRRAPSKSALHWYFLPPLPLPTRFPCSFCASFCFV
jgi:hypothetical protein